MSFLNNLRVKYKFLLIVAIAVSGFFIFGGVAYFAISKVRIDGNLYKSIVTGRDLVSDTVPPTMSLLEIQALIVDMSSHNTPDEATENIPRVQKLQADYNALYEVWKQRLANDPELMVHVEKAYAPSVQYFGVLNAEWIPAARGGDYKKTFDLAHGKMTELYDQHFEATSTMLDFVTARNKAIEEQASATVRNSELLLLGIGALISILVMAIGYVLAEILSVPMREMSKKLEAIALGDVDQECDYRSKDEVGKIADGFRAMTEYLRDIRDSAEALSVGNTNMELAVRSEKDVAAKSLNKALGEVRKLVSASNGLIHECSNGNIGARADLGIVNGGYRELLDGMNKMLDAIGKRAQRVANGVERLRSVCITNLGNATEALAKGDLSYNIEMCNSLLNDESPDAIGDMARSIDAIINQTEATVKSFETSRETILDVISNLNSLIDEAKGGDIDARADESKFQGSYATILSGMNVLLETVGKRVRTVAERVNQLKETSIVNLGKANEELSRGNLDFAMCESAPFLKDTSRDSIGVLARTIDTIITETRGTVNSFEQSRTIIKNMVAETKMLTTAANDGNIQIRGDEDQFKGSFGELISGINGTLDAFLAPVNDALECLERVARKDLTAHMEGEYKGDFARMKTALNTALTNLDDGMSQIVLGADQVASAAGEISTGAQTLAHASSEQASTLEEVAANLQEVSSMTRQNVSNSKEAQMLSDTAREAADGGMQNMGHLSSAIEKIKESSDSTAKIVKTIEEIAFQTNLLALNAAVEAARAGDAGKGFAVVAEEVRNLAMRSAEAAQSTAQLIEESVKNTNEGVAMNAQVSESLHGITEQIAKVSVVMAEIAAASEQQNQGVDQINHAIEQLNSTTQHFAANSEESASAAEELSSQSQEILGLIGGFTLASSTPKKSARTSAKRSAKGSVVVSTSGTSGRTRSVGLSPSQDKTTYETSGSAMIPFDESDAANLSEF